MLSNPPSPPLKKGRVIYILLFFSFILILHPPSSQSSNLFKYHQVAMGTVIEITLIADDEEAANKASLQAFQEIKRIETLMSPWLDSSDVTRINRSAGKERVNPVRNSSGALNPAGIILKSNPAAEQRGIISNGVKVSPETFEVIQKAQEISELSEGGFDITVGPLTELWRKAREKKIPPSIEDVKGKLDLVNFKNIGINPEGKVFLKKKDMAIDLGGIAKGYAVDRAFELLKSLGYRNLIVNAGGDLRVGGLKNNQPWSIGIQNPRESQKILARISVSDMAVATSGDYEKFFNYEGKRYHHIFNPKDGFPTEGCQSVTIVTKDCITADGLATAVFVLGSEKGYSLCQKFDGVKCLIVDKEGKIIFSPSLKDRISFGP
jgi:thiamine biosynthesis lipoprotein